MSEDLHLSFSTTEARDEAAAAKPNGRVDSEAVAVPWGGVDPVVSLNVLE